MTNNANLQQVNTELIALLEYCQKANLSEEDISNVCQPLSDAVTKAKFKRRLLQTLILTALVTSAYYCTTNDTISWHLSAIGRIALIKALPIWNWQHLKTQKCLLTGPNPTPTTDFECTLCEALDHVPTLDASINPTFLKQRYIDLHTPVIIPEALSNWSEINVQQHSIFTETVPCKLSTNIHSGFTTTTRIISKLENFDQYFLHFQNCNLDAMKTFRLFTPKPRFLPAELSPVQYNWLLMSRNYNVSSFKSIELKEAITLFGQMQGSNFVRLLPRLNCEDACPLVEMQLFKGEALIFSSMWDLEYKPDLLGENVAVILEMH